MIMRKFGFVNHFALIVCLVANQIWVQRRKWPFEVHLESPHGSMLTSPLTTTCKTRGKEIAKHLTMVACLVYKLGAFATCP
jgi:hypothetical protein